LLGSIKVAPPKGAGGKPAPEASAAAAPEGKGWEIEPYQARPDLRAAARSERRLAQKARAAEAEIRGQARWAEMEAETAGPGAEPPAPATPDAPARVEVEEKTQAPAADPSVNPLDLLADLGVNLSRWGIRHIFKYHGAHAPGWNGRFAAQYLSEPAMTGLLATCMNEAELARERRWPETYDRWARHITYCTRKGVGTVTLDGVNWVLTDRFMVVTDRVRTAWGVEHDVVSAYPIT
jgi:hypothetical protein